MRLVFFICFYLLSFSLLAQSVNEPQPVSADKKIDYGFVAGFSKGRIKNGGWYPSAGGFISFKPAQNPGSSVFGMNLTIIFLKEIAGEIVYTNGNRETAYRRAKPIQFRPFYRGYISKGEIMPFYEAGLSIPISGTIKADYLIFNPNENGLNTGAVLPDLSIGAAFSRVTLQLNLGYLVAAKTGVEIGFSTRISMN